MAAAHEEKRYKPKAASEQLYEQLSKEYYIRLACDHCTSTNPKDPLVQTYRKLPQHRCSEHRLLLQSKTEVKNRDNWTLIRSRPRSYVGRGLQDGDICEFAVRGHQCPDGIDCDRAHSHTEHYVWVTSKVDVSVFIDDVRTSSLLLRSFVTRVCKLYDGGFELICKKCFSGNSISSKKQHVVEFECGHTGTECKLLVFRSKNEPNKIVTLETDSGDDFGEIVSEWTLLKTNNSFSDDEIYEESRRLTQANDSAKQAPKQSKLRQMVTEDNYDLPEEYAEQIADEQAHILDTGVFDEYESVQNLLQSRRKIDNDDFIVRDKHKEPYYENVPVNELKEYLNKPDLYKRCHITLKNHDNAECRVINTSYEAGEGLVDRIEVRGRRNCGQCFSGDEVLVEILEHAGTEQKVPLGKVVGVLKHNIDCRSHVFVCSSLSHVPNLMTPIRGTAPKIRVVDSLIMKKYKNQKQYLAEVFDGEFTMRHIVRLPQNMHRNQILFVVKLHSWNSRNASPLGYVTGILKSPEVLEDEIKLLNIDYQISWINEELANYIDLRVAHERGAEIHEARFRETRPCLSVCAESLCHCCSDDFRQAVPAKAIDGIDTRCYGGALTARELERPTHVAIGVSRLHSKFELSNTIDLRVGHGSCAEIEEGRCTETRPCLSVCAESMCDYCGQDLRQAVPAITIDSNGTRCFDDAFTVRELESSTHVAIGVHVTDVTELVPKGSELDKDAAEIMENWYTSKHIEGAGDNNRRLFPSKVRYTCSLTEGAGEKRVISVYLIVDRSSGEIKRASFCTSSRIKIIKNLSFQEAQKIINNSAAGHIDARVVAKVRILHEVAVKMRRMRLKEACNFYETQGYGELDQYPDASRLVEELSLVANKRVAELLTTRLPKHPLPLRMQLPPTRNNIKKWNQNYSDIRRISFYFARPEWFFGIPNGVQAANTMHVSQSACNMLRQLADEDSNAFNELLQDHLLPFTITSRSTLARRIVGSEKLHPRHEIAMRQWYKIKNQAEFVCSSAVHPGTWRHFDLNFDSYVQFTSPLRRYLDLVVQRILKSLLLNDKHPYESQDIQDLCFRFNRKHEVVKTHQKVVEEIDLVKDFKDKGSPVACTVAEFDDSGLVLSFSNLQINYRHISIRKEPIVKGEKVHLTWELRRFNTAVPNTGAQLYRSPAYAVGRDRWVNVRNEIVSLNESGILNRIRAMDFNEGINCPDGKVMYDRMGRMCLTFSSVIQAGMKLEVQFGNYGISKNGTRELQIELLYLPNNLDFCILHNQHPVECLSSSSAYGASTKETYASIEQYKGTWLPILSLESATNAVGDTIVCEYVPLSFASTIGPPYCATLTLEKQFCKTHHIEFLLRNSRRVNGRPDPVQDFLCLRYKTGLTTPDGPMRIWVAHGLITSFETCNSTSIVVNCSLRQFNFPLPPNFSGGQGHCTVEFLIKNLTDRRRESAVSKENMNSLCKSIILNNNQRHRFAASWPQSEVEKVTKDLEGKLNDEQIDAIQKALGHKFYLIHGPPGTGKTVAGVHLTRCLVELNRKRETSSTTKSQVLYCGPSNSSVDVSARKLLELFGSEISVVRVYSKTKENEDFEDPVDDVVMSRSLHRLIRHPGNKTTKEYSDKINNYEKQHGRGIRVWTKAARDYNKNLRKAEELELNSCEVIFCTLVTSASWNIVSMTQVTQVIIDECGMSAEPDCLIALTSFPRIEQVVLIGDHQQLQPIVLNYDARRLGLGKSLFERYSKSNKLTMLTKQYRMHDSICRFPSDYFYQGRLVTALPGSDFPAPQRRLWPAGEKQRIVFCHVEGKEGNQKVATGDGNLFSKSNKEEQIQVIKVVKFLINDCKIPDESIAVLSQYKAQCSQLQKMLKTSDHDVHISTIVASQGKEWEYVILSTVRSLSANEIDLHPQKQWLSNHLGIVADPHQVNVALTRAKSGLIIIGNKHLLKAADMWRQLITHYEDVGCLVDADKFPQTHRS